MPYPDASFDLAISEYGACLWADPSRWVPEAARILRPGGALIFLVNSALLMLCMPEEDGLASFGMACALGYALQALGYALCKLLGTPWAFAFWPVLGLPWIVRLLRGARPATALPSWGQNRVSKRAC